jgi:hypothetical protein
MPLDWNPGRDPQRCLSVEVVGCTATSPSASRRPPPDPPHHRPHPASPTSTLRESPKSVRSKLIDASSRIAVCGQAPVSGG